jgi:hypothetical protein
LALSIHNTVVDASGDPITNARIVARLITRADETEAPAYYAGKQILGVWETTSEGVDSTPGKWRLSGLISNADPGLSPANTYYLITTTVSGRPTIVERVLVPNDNAAHWVGDILHTP